MFEYTQWITEQIRRICETYKNRTAGSASVRAAMFDMAAQLQSWSDHVETEDFTLHPRAFMGSIPLQAVFCICGIGCYILGSRLTSDVPVIVSVALFLFAAVLWLLEYVLYRRAFDFLFPKRRAVNVFAERKARVESKQRIILCGHADAAYEMSFFSPSESLADLCADPGSRFGNVCLSDFRTAFCRRYGFHPYLSGIRLDRGAFAVYLYPVAVLHPLASGF